MSNENRRETLKALALSAPAVWSIPMLTSVVLPAHAQTSSFQCTTQVCVSSDVENEEDAVYLLSDGDTCSFVRFNCCNSGNLPNSGGDRILMLDLDSGPPVNWDANDEGDSDETIPIGDDNWDVEPNPGDDNDSGLYMLTATRTSGANAGNIYQIALNVTLSGPGDGDACMDVTAAFNQVS